MIGPRRGPPHGRWWRRRFLSFAVGLSVLWVVFGLAFGWAGRDGGGGGEDGRGGPPVFLPVAVVAAVVTTAVVYRRSARPAADLLDSARRIGEGEYAVRVRPGGPRAVRELGVAFNDMAQRLERSESARRRLLADVTHELRTPLTVLRAGIEAQLDGIHESDDEHLAVLLDQAGTLDRLVEDVRTLALGDAGALTLHVETIDVDALITDAVAAIAPVAGRREVSVSSGAEVDAEIDADPVRLGQVLMNLLTNAVRHTPPGGRVEVAAMSERDTIALTVSDTGTGISGDPELVFERFRSSDTGGSGLGLTIARQLVEAHGGRLVAANRPTGGASFTATLPRHGGR